MIRNIAIAVTIGSLATYLPFFEWEGSVQIQIIGALALSVDTFFLLLATEKGEWQCLKKRLKNYLNSAGK